MALSFNIQNRNSIPSTLTKFEIPFSRCIKNHITCLLITAIISVSLPGKYILVEGKSANHLYAQLDRKNNKEKGKYTQSTNTNYTYTPKSKRPSIDAGSYSPSYTQPTPTPRELPYSPSPTTSTPTYNTSTHYSTNVGKTGSFLAEYGYFMPFVIIIITYLFIWLIHSRNQKKYYQNVFIPEIQEVKPPPRVTDFVQSTLFLIKDKILNFNETAFFDRVNYIFFEVQNAKVRRDLKSVKPHLTDGYYNKLRFMINQLISEHKLLFIKDIIVKKISIVKFNYEDGIHKITVKIDASMIEALVDENNRSKIYSGSLSTLRDLSELWTFIKDERRDSPNRIDMPTKCNTCGAPIKSTVDENCEFCGSNIRPKTAENNWLLAEVIPFKEISPNELDR
ncbi:MAG: Tim44-like domain-containing protein [Deltaproteobacteria bacterium]|nr:Tim44-like domain-containing protein [Deltaproteobacteria bacterium]